VLVILNTNHMCFNYTHKYHILPMTECPSFPELFSMAKDFYVVRMSGGYAIVPELKGNGVINNRVV
jgi:hypothetical protein